jgi:hypothetical protein
MEGIRGLMGEKELIEEEWNDRRYWRNIIQGVSHSLSNPTFLY